MEEVQQFAQAVKRMRELQVRYFRTRSNATLRESKELETIVDGWIERLAPKQQQLFGKGK